MRCPRCAEAPDVAEKRKRVRACDLDSTGNLQLAKIYRLPTTPRTDSISLAESYPTPSLQTVSTFSMSSIFLDGSPLFTTRSACFPAAIVPMRSDSPRYCAPLKVAI